MSRAEDIMYAAYSRGLKHEVLDYITENNHKFGNMEMLPKLEEAYKTILSSKEAEGVLEVRKWESSMIHATTYNNETETLLVEFVDGREYSYDAVNSTEYTEFTNAESQGKYFLANIRNKKITHKIDGNEENGRS